jgi:hypothetical protein
MERDSRHIPQSCSGGSDIETSFNSKIDNLRICEDQASPNQGGLKHTPESHHGICEGATPWGGVRRPRTSACVAVHVPLALPVIDLLVDFCARLHPRCIPYAADTRIILRAAKVLLDLFHQHHFLASTSWLGVRDL